MTETFWIALMTGGFTLVAGVVGVALTHRYTNAQAEAARREDRRKDARAMIAQLVSAGVELARANDTLVIAYYKAVNDQRFWIDFPDTDTGKLLRQLQGTVQKTAGELRLTVNDAQLLQLIAAALEVNADERAMVALLDEAKETGGTIPDGPSAMRGAFAHYRELEEKFRAIEARAAELLRGAL